jgi:hypothetical protein
MKPTPERARPVYTCRLRGFTVMESDIVRRLLHPKRKTVRCSRQGDTDAQTLSRSLAPRRTADTTQLPLLYHIGKL